MDTQLLHLKSPVFSLESTPADPSSCLVSAGGGSSKTGILNFLKIIAWAPPDAKGASEPKVLHSFPTGDELVFATSVSEDGSLLAAMTTTSVEIFPWASKKGSLQSPMQKLSALSTPGSESQCASCVSFGRGRLLAVGAEDGVVRIYDIQEPTQPQLMQTLQSSLSAVQALAWSPSGKLLAACYKSGVTRVFCVAGLSANSRIVYHSLASQGASVVGTAPASSSRSRRSMPVGPCQSKAAAWSPCESKLYVLESTMYGGGALVKWTGGSAEQAKGKVTGVVGSTDETGAESASAPTDAGLLWFAELARKASSSPLSCMTGYTMLPGPAMRLLVGTSEGGVQCWSAAHLSLQWERPSVHAMSVSSLAVLHDGTAAVSGSPDHFLAYFPLKAPQARKLTLLQWAMWMLLLLAILATGWMWLAGQAEKALQSKGSEL